MTSLGETAFCNTLSSNTVEVKGKLDVKGIVSSDLIVMGEVHAYQKTLNDTSRKHKHTLKQEGSVFYLQFEEFHQITSMTSTDSQNSLIVTSGTTLNLSNGDTVKIMDLSVTDVNSIPKEDIVGEHVISNAQTSAFSITCSTTASDSGTSTVSGLLRIRRYKYLDMHGNGVAWKYGTTLPTSSHTNAEVFYE